MKTNYDSPIADRRFPAQTMLKRIWRQIEMWLAENAPEILKTLAQLATRAKIAAAEQQIGCRLPRAVQDSHLIHDGTKYETLLEGWELMSLENAVDARKFLKGLQTDSDFDVKCKADSEFIKPVRWCDH